MPAHGTHEPALVALSILIAIVTSYAALDLGGRVRASTGRTAYGWLATAAIAMGGGIFSMHFVAMLAFNLPGIRIDYHPGLTLLSLSCAIAVTGVGFFVVRAREASTLAFAASGIFMGIGIVSMHYIGMAAMLMPAQLSYDPAYVALSVVIAIVASCTAITLAFRETDVRQKLVAATVMGIAISGMHYTAMHGAHFRITAALSPDLTGHSLNEVYLAISVAAVTFLILVLGMGAAAHDRRSAVIASIDAGRQRFQQVVEAVPSGILVVTREGIITLANAQLETQFGYGRDELIGQPVEILIPPDVGAKHVALRKEYSRAPTTRRMGVGRDLYGRRKDGSEFPVEIGLNAIDAETTLATIVDITERKNAEERQALLTREIFHRTRNLLAVVQAVASRSILGNRSADEEREIFMARLGALSRSDSRLIEAREDGVGLVQLVQDETEGFPGQVKIAIDPQIRLPANRARDFSLIVHELVTNAAKYGALKTKEGTVSIAAQPEGEARICFLWVEHGGPPVSPPSSTGFGLSLLQMVARGMSGEAKAEFDSAGLRCEMSLAITPEQVSPLARAASGQDGLNDAEQPQSRAEQTLRVG